MTTNVQICNLGLGMLGLGETISSLTEGTTEAKYCNLFFDDARRHTLHGADWHFASIERSLALTGTAPDRWGYSYAYPTDCIRDREIIQTGRDKDPIEYAIGLSEDKTTKLIYTDMEDAILRFTTDISDPTLFSQGFVFAFAAAVAMNVAMPLTQDVAKLKTAAQLFQGYLEEAETANANNGHSERSRDANWISARD